MIFKRKLNKIGFYHFIQKSYYFDSVLINNFDLSKNEKLLFSNIQIIKDEKALLDNSLNFLRNFESFASICCGCTNPKNKVDLKRSIWFSSIGLEMKDFLHYYNLENEEIQNFKLNILKEMIKIQCPIILKDKNTVLIESEISPKKVINSSKRMRYFFNISEIHTCRSCSQKNKCKRFLQKYTGEPDFSDFTRVLIGFYNICKMYKKREESDKKELIPFVEKVQYFHFALFHVYNYLLKHKAFNYNNVEEGNRHLILKYLKEKRRNMCLVKNQLMQEKILHIPKNYSNTIIPTSKAKMKRKQKNIFEKVQRLRKRERISEAEEKFIWVEENEDDLYDNDEIKNTTQMPQRSECDDKDSHQNFTDIFVTDKKEQLDNTDLVEINNQNEGFPLLRFEYASKKMGEISKEQNINYNRMYNIYVSQIQKNNYANLDDIKVDTDILQCEEMLFQIPQQIGGYTFINYVEHSPDNTIFPLNENLYEGIQVYKREKINIDALWKDVENEKLNIKRIGFFDPFSIKQNYESVKQIQKAPEKKIHNENDITELAEDLTSFEESLYMKHKENEKRTKRKVYKQNETEACEYKPEDDEDERFDYFKKLQNENSNFNKHSELNEELETGYIFNGEENKSYRHTFNIRRKLEDKETNVKEIQLKEIEEEKKELIADFQREIKGSSHYICKNIKFPSLVEEMNDKNNGLESKKRRNRKKKEIRNKKE